MEKARNSQLPQEKIQECYAVHRTTRNARQREIFLAPEFPGLNLEYVQSSNRFPFQNHRLLVQTPAKL